MKKRVIDLSKVQSKYLALIFVLMLEPRSGEQGEIPEAESGSPWALHHHDMPSEIRDYSI